MAVKKSIDVNKLVYTPNKEAYTEPKRDRKGRIMLEALDDSGNNVWTFPHQLSPQDVPVYEDKRIGDLMTFALDKIDEKASGEEIRKRFSLSCKVEAAMANGGILTLEPKDWKCLESTLEGIKNPLFNYRIQEAIDTAETVKEE